jgi:hypothetical protein
MGSIIGAGCAQNNGCASKVHYSRTFERSRCDHYSRRHWVQLEYIAHRYARKGQIRTHGGWNASTNDSARALRARLVRSSDCPSAAIRHFRRRPQKHLRQIRHPGCAERLLGQASGRKARDQDRVAAPGRPAWTRRSSSGTAIATGTAN